jgi:predicted nucleotidyltransferase
VTFLTERDKLPVMDRTEIITRLRKVEPKLKHVGVAALYLFGSYARDEGGPDSDVDVFVDKMPGGKFGFDEFMAAYELLQQALPEVDIQYGTREGLSKYIRADVEREAIRIL